MRKALSGMKSEEALEQILEMFMRTKDQTRIRQHYPPYKNVVTKFM